MKILPMPAGMNNDLTAPSKDAKSFDRWFYSQSKTAQQDMRDRGVYPYAEMVKPLNVFQVIPNHPDWERLSVDKDRDGMRTETSTFIDRDRVGVMLNAFITALAMTDSMAFRRHVELVRWSLALPGCMTSRQIAAMHRRSHTYIENHAKLIRRQINRDACGLFPALDDVRRTGRGCKRRAAA